MTITDKSIKLLWSNAAGRCSFTGCDERLAVEQAADSAPYTIGEMAHIKGKSKGGSRYDKHQNALERDGYENLILLCPNHHTLIDKPENEEKYSPEILLEMKHRHEARILSRLNSDRISNIEDLKNEISTYLSENKQAWLQYGPHSENAKNNPHSEALSAIWFSERLATIVPNNRVVAKLLDENRKLFNRSAHDAISKFLLHKKSYEQWVRDEVPYQAVLRFPKEFEMLIMEG